MFSCEVRRVSKPMLSELWRVWENDSFTGVENRNNCLPFLSFQLLKIWESVTSMSEMEETKLKLEFASVFSGTIWLEDGWLWTPDGTFSTSTMISFTWSPDSISGFLQALLSTRVGLPRPHTAITLALLGTSRKRDDSHREPPHSQFLMPGWDGQS